MSIVFCGDFWKVGIVLVEGVCIGFDFWVLRVVFSFFRVEALGYKYFFFVCFGSEGIWF